MSDDIPVESLDDFVIRELVEPYGFRVRPKVQWGHQKWETSVEHGHNLTFYYIKDGSAIQFELWMNENGPVEREFWYITSPELLNKFHAEFKEWINKCIKSWEPKAC